MGLLELLDELEKLAKQLPTNPLFDHFKDDVSFYIVKWKSVLTGGYKIELENHPQIYFSEMSDDMIRTEMEETGEIS